MHCLLCSMYCILKQVLYVKQLDALYNDILFKCYVPTCIFSRQHPVVQTNKRETIYKCCDKSCLLLIYIYIFLPSICTAQLNRSDALEQWFSNFENLFFYFLN